MKKRFRFLPVTTCVVAFAWGCLGLENALAQNVYTVHIDEGEVPIVSGHLRLGAHRAPNGDTLDANSLYFVKNGKPWYPVMGEIHFARYPRSQWEDSILKMKACGIDVIATYIFWIYHEEEEGAFDWSDRNDLRAFAGLCKKHNVFLFVRIGPWCHGEVRNGGFPDWLVKRGKTRQNDPLYLASARKLYGEMAGQLKGLYFKDGGPVIGAQIENEYRFNNAAGLEHMLTLKKMAVRAGIDVPYYTATGWPGSDQKQDELIPVWGAYPEAPWDKRTVKLPLPGSYLFSKLRNDPAIGSDLLGKQDEIPDFKGYRYPYATAEMGGGNQITYHRRPLIAPDDVTALAYVRVGSGANLMGYYMFHGGSNPIGKKSTFQESKATRYPNDCPVISYDFQAPIGEWGQLRPSYREFKALHSFLNDFGGRLAACYPFFPDKKPSGPSDTRTLRFSVRSRGDSGFVFISNFQRQVKMEDIQGVTFDLKTPRGEAFSFPDRPITVKSGLQAVFPFNMNIEGANLKYATAQPLCLINGTVPLYVFFAPPGVDSEYVFDANQITAVEAAGADVENERRAYRISHIKPGFGCVTELSLNGGKTVRLLTLSRQQARDAWKARAFGEERLFVSDSDLTFPQEKIRIQSTGRNVMTFSVFPGLDQSTLGRHAQAEKRRDGIFDTCTLSLPKKELYADYKEIFEIDRFCNQGERLPLDDRNSGATEANPGPQYQTNLAPVEKARYFEIDLPKEVLKNLGDVFLSIDYFGDTGSMYLDGKLIADDFYSGPEMVIGLKRFGPGIGGKKLLFQIVPLTDERQIYFEEGVREAVKGKGGGLRGIKLLPQYEFVCGGTGN